MITFYPSDNKLWCNIYHDDTLQTTQFYDTDEFMGFLKQCGIQLDNPEHPLCIYKTNGIHATLGHDVFEVVQRELLGWVKDDIK